MIIQQDEKYDHIEKEEAEKVEKAHREQSAWYNESMQKQVNAPKHQDPIISIADIQSHTKVT